MRAWLASGAKLRTFDNICPTNAMPGLGWNWIVCASRGLDAWSGWNFIKEHNQDMIGDNSHMVPHTPWWCASWSKAVFWVRDITLQWTTSSPLLHCSNSFLNMTQQLQAPWGATEKAFLVLQFPPTWETKTMLREERVHSCVSPIRMANASLSCCQRKLMLAPWSSGIGEDRRWQNPRWLPCTMPKWEELISWILSSICTWLSADPSSGQPNSSSILLGELSWMPSYCTRGIAMRRKSSHDMSSSCQWERGLSRTITHKTRSAAGDRTLKLQHLAQHQPWFLLLLLQLWIPGASLKAMKWWKYPLERGKTAWERITRGRERGGCVRLAGRACVHPASPLTICGLGSRPVRGIRGAAF